jgi:intracellular septation protein
MERLLGHQLSLEPQVWGYYNLSWGVFFLVVGALNLYVAFFYGLGEAESVRQATWVNFKVFGLMGLTLAFALVQALFLARYIKNGERDEERH